MTFICTLWLRQGKQSEPSNSHRSIRNAIWSEPPAARYVISATGQILSSDEPDGFDSDYSLHEYVDERGQPYSFPKIRQRRAQLRHILPERRI